MPAFLRARQREDESSGTAVWRQLEFCQALPARGIQEIPALGPSQEEVFQILEVPNGILVALETTPPPSSGGEPGGLEGDVGEGQK
jgi:hypothetical protein